MGMKWKVELTMKTEMGLLNYVGSESVVRRLGARLLPCGSYRVLAREVGTVKILTKIETLVCPKPRWYCFSIGALGVDASLDEEKAYGSKYQTLGRENRLVVVGVTGT